MTRTALNLLCLFLFAILTVGCAAKQLKDVDDPPIRVLAMILTMDSVDEDGNLTPGEPIAGATIKSDCRGGIDYMGESDQDGRFIFARDGVFPRYCEFVISKEGYITRRIDFEDVCPTPPRREEHELFCGYLSFTARLVPDEDE